MDRLTREMTFEEEYVILQKEAKELFDKEDRKIEPPESNCVVRRALRCIKKLVSELEELKDYQDKNKMVVRVDVENVDSIKNKIDELSKYAESQYNKAIDDFANWLVEQGILGNRCISDGEITDYGKVYAKKYKEQLKEQNNE